jgi:hypothetical protein
VALYEFQKLVLSILEMQTFKYSSTYLSTNARYFLNSYREIPYNPHLINDIHSILEDSKYNTNQVNQHLRIGAGKALGFRLDSECTLSFRTTCCHLNSFFWQEYYSNLLKYSKYIPGTYEEHIEMFLNDIMLLLEYQARFTNILYNKENYELISYGPTPNPSDLNKPTRYSTKIPHPLL